LKQGVILNVGKKNVLKLVETNIDAFLGHATQKYGCFTLEDFLYTYYRENDYYYIAVTDKSISTNSAISLLKDVVDLHRSNMGNDKTLKELIAQKMNDYNVMPQDKIKLIQNELQDTKNVMISNLKQLENRGVKLDVLVDQVEGLEESTVKFKGQSRVLSSTMWWKNIRLRILTAIVILAILFVIALLICGGFTFIYCRVEPAPERAPPAPTTTEGKYTTEGLTTTEGKSTTSITTAGNMTSTTVDTTTPTTSTTVDTTTPTTSTTVDTTTPTTSTTVDTTTPTTSTTVDTTTPTSSTVDTTTPTTSTTVDTTTPTSSTVDTTTPTSSTVDTTTPTTSTTDTTSATTTTS